MAYQLFQTFFDGIAITVRKECAWFAVQDVLAKLGLSTSNATIFLSRHVSPSFKRQISTGVGRPKWYVSEEGAYQMGMRSSTPEAGSVQRWIFEMVLPAVIRNGGYFSPNITQSQAIALKEKLDRVLNA